MKGIYEEKILEHKFNEAKDILNSIDESISHSFWGVEQRMILSQLDGGFETNKKTLSNIAGKTTKYLTLLISNLYSYKAEIDSSYSNFSYNLNRFLEGMTDDFRDILYKDYLEFQFKLLDDHLKEENLRRILSLSATFPIIDLYENLLRVCTIIISSDKFSYEIKKSVTLKLMSVGVNDKRIKNIIYIAEAEKINSLCYGDNANSTIFLADIIEEYTTGNYLNCINLIQSRENELYKNFETIEILIKCALYLDYNIEDLDFNNSFMKESIILPMYKTYACIDKHENLTLLLNSAKILGNVSYKYKILNFYNYHSNTCQVKRRYYNVASEINSRFLTPRFFYVYRNDYDKLRYLDLLEVMNQFPKTVQLFKAYTNCEFDDDLLLEISRVRFDYYRIKANRKVHLNDSIIELERMLKETLKIQTDKNNYKMFQYERIATQLYNAYIRTSDLDKAISILVDSYMLNKSTIVKMNKTILKNQLAVDENRISNNIKEIILHYLIDQNDYLSLYTSLANFLDLNKMYLPSDLIKWSNEYPLHSKEVNFILNKIYTKEIMKYFVRIDPKKRSEERIDVLKYLIKVDIDNSPKYIEEINNIIRAQRLQQRIKSVDEKKIYVDTDAILKHLESLFLEKYRRYAALKELDSDLNYFDVNATSEWIKFSEAISKQFSESQEKKQRYLLFKELISEIKTEILNNQNYGLNKFLSSRIRHGVLENNLSKTFKNYNLLSLKIDSEAKDFTVNKYWDDESEKYEKEYNDIYLCEIKNALASFSEKIIEKISEVKDWIRIPDKDYPNGMFNYNNYFDESRILILYGASNSNIEFRTFYDGIIDYFWLSTERILEEVRSRINNELFKYFLTCLDELKKEVELLKIDNEANEMISNLLTKINLCRAILKSDLQKISDWFVVRRYGECYNFNMNDLLSTFLEINDKTNQKYSLIEKTVSISTETSFKEKNFNYLMDIITILYSNAIQHSGFDKFEDMVINIEISEIASSEIADTIESTPGYDQSFEFVNALKNSEFPTLSIRIKNKLDNSKKAEDITKKISEIFEKIKNPEKYKKMISEEGGTGLSKINNILKFNIPAIFFHQYFVDEDNWFNANININVENIIVD